MLLPTQGNWIYVVLCKCSKSLTFQPKHCTCFPYPICFRLDKKLVSWDSTGDLFGVINSDFLQASSKFLIARRKSFVSLVTYSNIDIGHSRRCSTSFGSVQCKLYCAISSAWAGVELRFFPWLLLFKYWTDGSNLCSSVCRYYVYLKSWPNEWERAFFVPAASSRLCCDTQRRMRLFTLRSGWDRRNWGFIHPHKTTKEVASVLRRVLKTHLQYRLCVCHPDNAKLYSGRDGAIRSRVPPRPHTVLKIQFMYSQKRNGAAL